MVASIIVVILFVVITILAVLVVVLAGLHSIISKTGESSGRTQVNNTFFHCTSFPSLVLYSAHFEANLIEMN